MKIGQWSQLRLEKKTQKLPQYHHPLLRCCLLEEMAQGNNHVQIIYVFCSVQQFYIAE